MQTVVSTASNVGSRSQGVGAVVNYRVLRVNIVGQFCRLRRLAVAASIFATVAFIGDLRSDDIGVI